MKKVNRNISVKNFMIEMMYAMNEQSNLEFETIVRRVITDDPSEVCSFISHIGRGESKVYVYVQDIVLGD